MRNLLVSAICVLAMATFASAAGLQVVSATIDPGPGQQVMIVSTGTGNVSGVSLQVQVGDGGEALGGVDRPGLGGSAAAITGVDFRGPTSMWGAAGAAAELPNLGSDAGAPLLAFPVFVLAGQNVTRPAPGGVATLILDATGLENKSFQIMLEIPAADVKSNFNGVEADALIGAMITVTPEPVSALLLLAAAPFLRRRRA